MYYKINEILKTAIEKIVLEFNGRVVLLEDNTLPSE